MLPATQKKVRTGAILLMWTCVAFGGAFGLGLLIQKNADEAVEGIVIPPQNVTQTNTTIVYVNQTVTQNVTVEPPLRDLERLGVEVTIEQIFGAEWSGTLSPVINVAYSHPDDTLGQMRQRMFLEPIDTGIVDLCEDSTLIYDSWFLTATTTSANATTVTYQNEAGTFPYTGLLLPGPECASRITTASTWTVTLFFEIDGILGPVVQTPDGGVLIDEWDGILRFIYES